MNSNEARSRNYAALVVGLSAVTLGIIFLLDQEGVIRAGQVFRFWPAILVLVGVARVAGGRTNREKAWGGTLVLFGAVFLFSALHYRYFQFKLILPFLVIAGGLWILWWALETPTAGAWSTSQLNQLHIFGGAEYRITSKNFRGGRLMAIFGGFKLDLLEADIEGNEAVIDISAIFGGGEIIVPRSWEVSVRGAGVLGGHQDETRRFPQEPQSPKKVLTINGMWVLGGLHIRN
jgi:hypothetical protein